MSKCFAIGDVHGDLDALKNLIKSLDLSKGDKLIFLGDYIDKGPYSKGVMDYLIDLKDHYKCVFILGNHEERMLLALDKGGKFMRNWINHGGKSALKSYDAFKVKDWKNKIPQSHKDFLTEMVDAYETPTHVFVHAGWDSTKKIEQQKSLTLRYKFLKASTPDNGSGRTIICGHSSTQSGYPVVKGDIICIDTIKSGWLTGYDVKKGRYYQAHIDGKTRQFDQAEAFSKKRHVPKCDLFFKFKK